MIYKILEFDQYKQDLDLGGEPFITSIPTLFLSGGRDFSTPPYWVEIGAHNYKNHRHFFFGNEEHTFHCF